jgi:hypothetical protein
MIACIAGLYHTVIYSEQLAVTKWEGELKNTGSAGLNGSVLFT